MSIPFKNSEIKSYAEDWATSYKLCFDSGLRAADVSHGCSPYLPLRIFSIFSIDPRIAGTARSSISNR